MCLIFLSLNNHPTYKLVVAANRDEFYNRKTAAAEFWKDQPQILGGRDLEAGGTWMGITRSGRLGMITNYRDPVNIHADAPSRGHLVSDYLAGKEPPHSYMKKIEPRGNEFNGFNLLVGTTEALWYYSNYKKGIEQIKSGYYGLSNHLLETPWPKVVRGKEKLKPLFEEKNIEVEKLFNAMYDETRAPDQLLPDTGVELERERALSAMFIKSPNYGSRCTTVVTVDRDDHIVFAERVYELTNFDFKTRRFEFQVGHEELIS